MNDVNELKESLQSMKIVLLQSNFTNISSFAFIMHDKPLLHCKWFHY